MLALRWLHATRQRPQPRWLDEHTDLFEYRDELRAQASARQTALGIAAATEQPSHLTDLLGQLPTDPEQPSRWISAAAHVEAYREEWLIEPDDLRRPPLDGVQYDAWNVAVRSVEISIRLDAFTHDRSLERGLDRGLGIEL